MNLAQALRNPSGACLAFAGAGGKTTAIFQLAQQLFSAGKSPSSVIVTTTTHLGAWQGELASQRLALHPGQAPAALLVNLPPGVLLLTGPEDDEGRLTAPDGEALREIYAITRENGWTLLIEADGARGLPLKAPAEHEPVIPDFVDLVVVVAGISAMGQSLDSSRVHRPERFAALSGLAQGEAVTAQAVGRVLLSEAGGLKGIPPHARRVALLNQADSPELQGQAHSLAGSLLAGYESVLVAALGSAPGAVFAVHEAVAGVVLAAGGSERFGQPKQLLTWQGETLARRAAQAALQGGLSPVVVVTGAHQEQVIQALAGLPVRLVSNPDWTTGQSTSLRLGLSALPPEVGAAIFLLADQPAVTPTLLAALVEAHARGLHPLAAPLVDGQRGNPVLFDRSLFGELQQLQGDVGGRALFSRYPIHYLPWHDADLLLDIDTPEDYQRLLGRS